MASLELRGRVREPREGRAAAGELPAGAPAGLPGARGLGGDPGVEESKGRVMVEEIEYVRQVAAVEFFVDGESLRLNDVRARKTLCAAADRARFTMAASMFGRDLPAREVARYPDGAWQAVRAWAATLIVLGWLFRRAEARWPVRWVSVWCTQREWVPDLAGQGRCLRVARLSHEPAAWEDAGEFGDW